MAKSLVKTSEVFVTSFCLNCRYKLPVRSVVSGIRRATPPVHRKSLRLASFAQVDQAPKPHAAQGQLKNGEKKISPPDYSRHLRALGQDLERRRLEKFNLECTGSSYLVWARSGASRFDDSPLLRLGKNRLQKLWKNKTQSPAQTQEEYSTLPPSHPTKQFHYSLREIDRIDRQGRARRRRNTGTADGHSLSQLLRTVGTLVNERDERLLGISWQDLSVSIVVETAQGRREIDVFRHDNLYDLWVRMYLRRGNRFLSDTPR